MTRKTRLLGDSNLLIAFLRGNKDAQAFFARTNPDDLAYSVVTYLEVASYEFMRDARIHRSVTQIFGKARLLPFTAAMSKRAARVQGQLVRSNRLMSIPDLQIAATAEDHGLVLVTRNVGDFQLYGDLKIQRW